MEAKEKKFNIPAFVGVGLMLLGLFLPAAKIQYGAFTPYVGIVDGVIPNNVLMMNFFEGYFVLAGAIAAAGFVFLEKKWATAALGLSLLGYLIFLFRVLLSGSAGGTGLSLAWGMWIELAGIVTVAIFTLKYWKKQADPAEEAKI